MRFMSVLPAAFGVVLIAACDVPSDQGVANPLFSRQITFAEFDATLSTGVARLEIELRPLVEGAPAVAEEVEIEQAEDAEDEESVEASALRFENLETSTSTCRGTIVLAPAFTVQFDDATTTFEGGENEDLTCAQFVERVQAGIADGGQPVVEAERPAPAAPQAPDAAAFAAAELKLEGDDSAEPELEINVDDDNLLPCSSLTDAPTGCLGVLKVLNVSIALVEGVTELEAEEPNEMDEADFRGVVASVVREGTSCTIGTVTLVGGTVVHLVAATDFDNSSGDDKQLDDLCAVETALAVSGTVVEAEGEGFVTGDDPRTILASEAEFEAEDDDHGGD